jgi:hypothetical protein
VRFSLGAVTAAADLTIQVESVGSTGLPSGTVAWTDASATLASASVTEGVHEVDLTAAGPVTADAMLAITIITAAAKRMGEHRGASIRPVVFGP